MQISWMQKYFKSRSCQESVLIYRLGRTQERGKKDSMNFGGFTRLSVGTERDQSPSAEHKGVYRGLTAPAW